MLGKSKLFLFAAVSALIWSQAARAESLEAIFKGTADLGEGVDASAFEADVFFDTTLGTITPSGIGTGTTFTGLPDEESASISFDSPIADTIQFAAITSFYLSNYLDSTGAYNIALNLQNADGGSFDLYPYTYTPIPLNVASSYPVTTVYGSGGASGSTESGGTLDAYLKVQTAEVVDLGPTTVTGVPLPNSAPMFGAALLALGAVSYGLKRTKAAAA